MYESGWCFTTGREESNGQFSIILRGLLLTSKSSMFLSNGKDSSDVGVLLQYNTIQLEFNTSIEKKIIRLKSFSTQSATLNLLSLKNQKPVYTIQLSSRWVC